MSTVGRSPDRLFELMPATYRIADVDQGHPLGALLRLVNEHADVLRDDIERLWDDFFIETCQRWVVPYIGDLVGNVPLIDPDMAPAAATAEALFTDLAGPGLMGASPVRSRADVAKTISYRRRKGTPAMLEELATDVTGWGVVVSEFFLRLGWTQHLEHLRRAAPQTPDLRPVDPAGRRAGPWDRSQHHVDVRAIGGPEGWFNIHNLGIFVWRLMAQPRTKVAARQVGTDEWRFTFSPLGQDVWLYSAGDFGPSASGRTREEQLDAPLRREAFFNDLRSLPAGQQTESSRWYGPAGAARLRVWEDGKPVDASDIACANLGDWTSYLQPAGERLLIDPTRGRLLRPSGHVPKDAEIRVSFCEGFSADIGGGEYERSRWLTAEDSMITVVPVAGGKSALETAISGRLPKPATLFRITDNATYDLTGAITLKQGERLTIEAANGQRPLVRLGGGSLDVASSGNDKGGSLTLSGLLVEGGLTVTADLGALRLLHCTLVPGRSVDQGLTPAITGPSLVVAGTRSTDRINAGLEVQAAACILGSLTIPAHITCLWLLDCIVDGITEDGQQPKAMAISDADATSGPIAHLERTTVLGSVRFSQAPMISESIITGSVEVGRRQDGCVRFSYVRSRATPRQYRCQPTMAINEAIAERQREAALQKLTLPTHWQDVLAKAVTRRVVPSVTSEQFGRPGYAQLHETCPPEIAAGAEDGSEMGAFCQLKNPQREANLRLRLEEYLPVGLEVGLIHLT